METIQISRENAIKAFENGTSRQKRMLTDLIGKENLTRDITARVKTFEDACTVLGVSTDISQFDSVPSDHRQALLATYKLRIIAQALNQGWKPDWTNSNEYKYYPWMKHSGSRFSSYDYYCAYTLTTVGSRLCYQTRELAEYSGKQFEDLYNDLLTF